MTATYSYNNNNKYSTKCYCSTVDQWQEIIIVVKRGEFYFSHIGRENIIFHTSDGRILFSTHWWGEYYFSHLGRANNNVQNRGWEKRRSFSTPRLGEVFFSHLCWEKIIFHTLVGRIFFTGGREKIIFSTYTTYYVVTPSNRVLIISTLLLQEQ